MGKKDEQCKTAIEYGGINARVNTLEGEQSKVRVTAHAAANKAIIAESMAIELKNQNLDKRLSILEQWQKDFDDKFDTFSKETKAEVGKLVDNNQKFLIIAGIVVGIFQILMAISKFII